MRNSLKKTERVIPLQFDFSRIPLEARNKIIADRGGHAPDVIGLNLVS